MIDRRGETDQWCPICPLCSAPGTRTIERLALDCTCSACGFFYTSARSRGILRALTRPRLPAGVEACEHCDENGAIPECLGAHGAARLCWRCAIAVFHGGPCSIIQCEEHNPAARPFVGPSA